MRLSQPAKEPHLALPLGELSRVSVTERVIEYLQSKYSIFPIFTENREALSDLASLGHLSQRERQVALFTSWDSLHDAGCLCLFSGDIC